ncbi:hypothetical protein CC78DRAFT_545329 [Lojkania enalia]|uniref:Uncharacterized protein n=1 Tax=Lojkania enalia TaxID=147567 RepID=A0A9P4N209_9PLEO|nr:hypothetical protein CC78DRAFT_545329 [Didymosphaeria enalia]
MTTSNTKSFPGLEFKLSQISKDPPSLLVTVKNNSPSSTFTFLKWGTPLDPQALNLGVFKMVDASTGKEVKIDHLMINRKMPPSRDDLQEVEPGTEQATEIVFDKPWMPDTNPAKYKVKVEGEFKGGWESPVSEVKAKDLKAYSDSSFANRAFASEETMLVVE